MASATIDAILVRRSVSPRRLTAPGPDDEMLGRIIGAALAAPDHGRLRPWRFLSVPDARRPELANAFRAAARELDPGAAEDIVEREAEKAGHGPCLVAVIARIQPDHPVAPESEQWISVGAALQNILLAAEALGFRAMIVSGRKVGSTALRKALDLSDHERLVGFVAIGTPEQPTRQAERPKIEDHFAVWNSRLDD